jgi:homoserine kinase
VAEAVSDAMVKAWEAEGVASSGAVLDLQINGSRWEPLPNRTH